MFIGNVQGETFSSFFKINCNLEQQQKKLSEVYRNIFKRYLKRDLSYLK